ncbi:uncharacterized protein LOC134546342 [Bacillus rossius redtenbacheri]|uniref:uncharacterized protein LOC134546342 n=1 Tax=Bacillus rossius redtenbacheri TaxID=93214 RepID=UPI002FDEA7CB
MAVSVSWVYQLHKTDLALHLEENGLPVADTDTVAEMRARLVDYLRKSAGAASEVTTRQPPADFPSSARASFLPLPWAVRGQLYEKPATSLLCRCPSAPYVASP